MENVNKNVPEIRFPGFTDPWEQRKFSDFTWNAGKRNSQNLDLEPYAVTNDRGFIRQNEAHDEFGYMKDVDRKAYNIVMPNSFAYNPARINVGSIGYYEGTENVIVSSLYEVFQTADYVDDRFLWHWFKSDIFPKWIERLQEGSVRLYFYYDKLCECKMLMPSLPEQKKIAATLDEIDNLITLHQRKCDELKKYKKGMLQQLFPQSGEAFPRVRFPGFTDPWEQHKFSDVFVGLQNNTLSRADLNYDQGEIRNVHYGDVLIKFGEYIDVTSADLPYINDSSIENKFTKSLLVDGDIIIADTAEDETVGKCCEITNSDGMKLLSGLHTIAVRPQQKYASKFLGYYLNSSAYHNQLLPLMQGIKVTSISKGAVQDTVLTVPTSIDEQGKIGECLSNLDDIITLHQRKCDELKKYKKGLLQKMFV